MSNRNLIILVVVAAALLAVWYQVKRSKSTVPHSRPGMITKPVVAPVSLQFQNGIE